MCEVQLQCNMGDCEEEIKQFEDINKARVLLNRVSVAGLILSGIKILLLILSGITGERIIQIKDFGIVFILIMVSIIAYFVSKEEKQIPMQAQLAKKISDASSLTLEKINALPYYRMGFIKGNEIEKVQLDTLKLVRGSEANKIVIDIDKMEIQLCVEECERIIEMQECKNNSIAKNEHEEISIKIRRGKKDE